MKTRLTLLSTVAVLVAAFFVPLAAQNPAVYAIKGARIITVAGAPIATGTVLMKNGIIEDVGATVNVPAEAIVIDGTNMTVYPGVIDMANTSVVDTPAPETPADPNAAQAGRGNAGAGRAGRGGNASAESWADNERVKRDNILNPDVEAARYVRNDSPELQRLAAAGITSVLAVPSSGLFRGQSALINTAAPAEMPEISTVASDRRGLVIVKAGVAEHVSFAGGRGGGGGYPGSLLGVMAFIRQSFYDAQWQKDARAFADRHKDAPRQAFEPSLDALAPALDGKMPVAFDANSEREILRALGFVKEFKLDGIIVGGSEAGTVVEDLKAAHARVICTLNFAAAGGRGGRGGGGGAAGGGGARPNPAGPKVAADLDKAGILVAFTSQGLPAAGDLIRGVGRVVRDGGMPADAAIRALTANAAKLAGVGDRLGTVEKGRIANLIVTDGDLFGDSTKVKYVFIDGRPVDIDAVPPPAPVAGRGRGGM